MLDEAARGERSLRVAEHVGVATQQDVSRFRLQPEAGARLQLAALDQLRDSAAQATRRRRLACDQRYVSKLSCALARPLCELLGVAEMCLLADAVREHDAREAAPDLLSLEHGQEWAQARAGGDQPEVPRLWDVLQREEAERAIVDPERVAFGELKERRRQHAAGHEREVELGRFPHAGRDRVRALLALPAEIEPQIDVLPRNERGHGDIERQTDQAVCPDPTPRDFALYPGHAAATTRTTGETAPACRALTAQQLWAMDRAHERAESH